MTRDQALLLMEKLQIALDREIEYISEEMYFESACDEEFKLRYGLYEGKIVKVKYFNNSSTIEAYISCENLCVGLKGRDDIKLVYECIVAKPLRIFSPVYRKWSSMKKKISKIHKEHKKVFKLNKQKEELEKFNRAYHEVFPDELNNIILGDNNNE